MTHPKQTPGQAAREAFYALYPDVELPVVGGAFYTIAAAAIEAAKQSGDLVSREELIEAVEKVKARYADKLWEGSCGDKDEREHCERVAQQTAEREGGCAGLLSGAGSPFGWADLLLSERAAADKAGYQRGRAELQPLLDETISKQLHAIELADLADDAETKARQELADELADAEHGYASIKQDLTKLQSRFDRLAAAAKQAEQAMREAADRLRAKHGYEPLAIIECADVLRDLVHAALAETEEKKT